jgi:hypothetical protein
MRKRCGLLVTESDSDVVEEAVMVEELRDQAVHNVEWLWYEAGHRKGQVHELVS